MFNEFSIHFHETAPVSKVFGRGTVSPLLNAFTVLLLEAQSLNQVSETSSWI